MYLSDLEIVGFKSFAQRINFKFAGGITGLVGPNGCGKTNIVDGIRWVLGEQKSSILRSDIMEDVIFNGTSKRKPLGMAEVSLTLQNSKGILPIEYNEVTITRRLFRNGDSQYLLNNTLCRLRDVLDLFMDTGMGSDSYSVIELKMVEAILSGKPEERRNLVEEAAGVKKYKQRRKEAGRKLQNVQTDLQRVHDIVQEVEKQVESLSRQAAKTRRYNKLMEQLKTLEVNLLYHQYVNYNQNLINFESELEEKNNEKRNRAIELNHREKEQQERKNELESLDEKFRSALEKENSINSDIAVKQQDIAVSNEKISSLRSSIERIERELSEYSEAFKNINDEITAGNNSIISLNENREITIEELNLKKEIRDAARNDVFKAREETALANEEIITTETKINSIYNDIDRGRNRKGSLERSINESKTYIEELRESKNNVLKEIKTEEDKRQEFNERLSYAENSLKSAQENQLALQSAMESLRDEISENKNELGGKKASLEFLEGLVDSDESSKFLFSETEWETGSTKTLFAEALGVDEQFRVAVGASLGDYAKYFVVDNKEQAYSAIKLLKDQNKGKASFICRDMIPEINAPSEIELSEGIYGWLSEIVRADDVLKNALRLISSKTLLVDNTETAWKVINNGLCETSVTLEGEIVRKSGLIRGGSQLQAEGLYVGKQERIKKLSDQIKILENKIGILDESLKNAKSEYDSIDIMNLNNKVRNSVNEKNNHEQIINKLVYKADGIDQNIDVMVKNNEMFLKELEEIDNESIKFKEMLSVLQEKLELTKEQQQSRIGELKIQEEILSGKEEEYHEVEMKKYRFDQEIISMQRELDSLNERKLNLEFTQKKRKNELEKNNEDIENLNLKIRDLENSLLELKNFSEETQSIRERLEIEIKSLKEQITQYSDDINQKRKDYERSFEAIHQLDLKVGELKAKQENIKNRAFEGYEIDLETSVFESDENFAIDETKAEVNDIKDKLTRLGNVNFMALEEYDTQNERYQFYQKQVADLLESEKNLIETIDEINLTAQKKFKDTFDNVNKYFKDLFKTLFGNDAESELQLSDGDPLESDIEIIAKPPGKRPRSIEGLSGGEKTLTAIALLFAIYLVKPSPFCILDEVDAPLDDANLGRFINLIRDFSKDTQFLIVTHNKKSMEAADSLYGITMEEEGISKVVSVRLSKENNN